ncbi:MAG: hypothetical protein GY805_28775, partial [Chloroflexi bacterium]|nr:hypothetical protein [Chloroflexota bacterium]
MGRIGVWENGRSPSPLFYYEKLLCIRVSGWRLSRKARKITSRTKVEYATGTALWYRAGFDPLPIRWVLVRDPAGKYESTAFLCTDQQACPIQILDWFILRWNVEVIFQEARALLGVETQRQWSDKAIARTTPALMGLFSLVVLFAYYLTRDKVFPVRTSVHCHQSNLNRHSREGGNPKGRCL